MCGIAGYSLAKASTADRTLAAQALLAGIAERGADAVGYAFRCGDDPIHVHKQRSGASALLDEIVVPACASQALVHVRDYTKGHPTIAANNHPVRHGAVVGIHNGIIFNDEELLAEYGIDRADPEMSVDSEVIFALAERSEATARAFEQLHGSMATAWLDEREPELLYVARGVGRPLWLGRGHNELFFASTRDALAVVERTLGKSLRKSQLAEGRILAVRDGEIVHTDRFSPDRSFTEESLPSVRAPHEGAFCLQRLYAIAGVAA
jgi:glucosamine 6-phosphate synthetase-like amidotransferase/phosphosugar isomerase protein